MKRLLPVLLTVVLISCEQSNDVAADRQVRVALTTLNLPHMHHGHYHLWATFFDFHKPAQGDSPAHEGEYISLGLFKVDDAGNVYSIDGGRANFSIPAESNPQLLKDVVISVETGGHGVHSEEPGSILMGGAFRGDDREAIADLSISYGDAFRTDFAGVSGKCTIMAPTSPADSNNGIWFVESGATVGAGLRNLPALPNGWRYEGWVVSGNLNQSTGRFLRADSADLDGAGPLRGTGAGLNFPGQDFVQGPVRPILTSAGFVFAISVEPEPDNSAEPFFLKVLLAQSGARVVSFANVLGSHVPIARVVIKR